MHNSSGNALQVYYVVDEAQSPSWRGGVGYVTPQVRKRCVLAQVSVHSSRLLGCISIACVVVWVLFNHVVRHVSGPCSPS